MAEPNGNPGTDPQPGGGTEGQEPKFTQAEVNRFIQQRLEREQAKYADYDELKTQLGELRQTLDDTKATVAEKEEAIGTFQIAQAQWEEERASRDLRDKIVEAARGAGFRYPEDAYDKLDLAEVTADPEKVSDFVTKLAEKRPDLLGKQVPGTGTTQPSRSGQTRAGAETKEEQLARLGIRPNVKVLERLGGQLILPPGFEDRPLGGA